MKVSGQTTSPTTQAMPRVETTLFLLASVYGKITTGASDLLDSDRDWKRIAGVKEGIHQYYKIEESLAICSLNTGRVMEKVGTNSRTDAPYKDARLTLFLIDRKPHLNENGIRYLSQRLGKLFIVTNNPSHPAVEAQHAYSNVETILYPVDIELEDLLIRIRQEYGIQNLVIESGGTMNAQLVRQGLVDHIMIIVAPLLVGGRETSTVMDGPSYTTEEELGGLRALKLVRCETLEHSYIRLEYDVINHTVIDPIM
jgi:2,5-diamino-6-(ribosylamino)-4(3H)-pyrimidinone 5'-phosphate reductase